MKFDTIEREVHVHASPAVVYEVVSTPDHIRRWWPDEAEIDPVPGAIGFVSFGDRSSTEAKVVPVTVVEADPPRRFSFRWAHDANEAATPANSLLVTFELLPSGGGTLLRFTETGFRARGLEGPELEAQYQDHSTAWDTFLPRLVSYVAQLVETL